MRMRKMRRVRNYQDMSEIVIDSKKVRRYLKNLIGSGDDSYL